MAAPQQQGSPAYVVYKVGGDPGDYQFLYEPPKEIPYGYVCTYVPDCNADVAIQTSAEELPEQSDGYGGGILGAAGSSGADAEKQAWLTKYATTTNPDSSTATAPTVDQISAILRDQFGILPKKKTIGYSKPYPNEYDLIPLPPKYRLPDFTKFSGSEGSSSIEHVSRYLAQLGMVSASEPLRVRFFAQSLTGPAFGWYTSLPPDSVRTWKQLEEQFHIQYHSEATEAGIADLTQVRQRRGETVSEYIQRFRTVKNQCYSVHLSEKEAVELAVAGLAAPLKDLTFQVEYNSLAHMVQRLTSYEQRHPELYQDKFKRTIGLVDAEEDEDPAEDQEVAVAEWTRTAVPVSCKWVKQPGPPKGFDFDLSKTEQIFDLLLKEKQLKLPEGHKIPTSQEMNGRPYCKWHHTFTHATNDCKVLRAQIQMAIESGRLIFGQFAMKVDTHPFPGVNMVDLSHSLRREPGFSFGVNMAGLGTRHGKDKAESSHSRGKEKEEADPRDRPQHDNRRMTDVGATTWMTKDIVGLMQMTGGIVDMIETMKGVSRLPTIENCPECRQQRKGTNEVSVFKRLGTLPPQDKRAESSQDEDFEESDEEEDRYHRPGGAMDSAILKRRVQRLRNLEEAEARYPYTLRKARPDLAVKIQQTLETEMRPLKKVWRPKQTKADAEASADTNMVFILPSEFCAPKDEEVSVAQFDCGPRPVIFEKPRERSYRHKALYLKGYIDGQPVNKMLVDTGAAVNIMPYSMLRRLGHSNDDLIKTNVTLSDFNGQASEAKGDGKLGYGFTSADELEEIDIGPGDKPRPTFISKKLDPHLRGLMIALLKEYPDCFAWDYTEMPGLDRSIIEHRLPLKKGFRPFQQRARQMKAEILVEVKKEIQKMLDAGFIRTCRRMLDAETRYPEIEKLCLCLFFTCTKIQHILLSAEIIVICKSDVIKHMLSAPVLKGRLGKWMFALSEFDIRYQPAKAVKGQALADLIAERINTDVAALSVRAWAMFFDGSVCEDGCGIGVLLVSPRGATFSFSIRIATPCTNNVAEYEAMCKGMELLLDAGAEAVEIFGDSKLVISQLTEEYKCESESLFPLWMQCPLMSDSIEDATELRLWSLEKIKENKAKVARAYNKKVKPKEFQVGDLVWEAVLPLGTKDKVYGKWSPNWHGPYKVIQVLKGNAYMLEQLDGVKFPVAVNGQHLKKYFPSMWDDGQ
ncbi:hypothetical protein QYE76_045097 [Lolium multiflorum]|uniref:RNase H type-1 domain-containing protein n=1 Tax=Lolium multiflorum TaxID=4521 RepID=A0AAD8TJV5_LOLMU|nr:hypothetical protein QYE76_045097 [Lolium multiflorum]